MLILRKCSGEPCIGPGAVYATEGYGFLCLPRNITERLADGGYTFDDADALLDLWCHTVWQDPRNIFSYTAPVVQYGQQGAALTLETLGRRWGWEKTKVWRFLKRHQDAFALHKLPGSFGCLIFNTQYPAGEDYTIPCQTEIVRILDEMRIRGRNTHPGGTDNERINRLIAVYSPKLAAVRLPGQKQPAPASRVAVSAPITRAYFSPSQCKNCNYDCRKYNTGILPVFGFQIRGPCGPP